MDIAERLTTWAIWLLVAGGVAREVFGQGDIAQFGPYTLHTIDPAALLAAVAACMHLAKGRLEKSLYSLPILAMAALILINFLRGIIADPAPALLWMRANGAIAAVLLLAIAMRPVTSALLAARQSLLVGSALLGILILLRLTISPTLFMIGAFTEFGANDGRPLSAQGAFLMVLASGWLTADVLRRQRFIMDAKLAGALALPILILLTRQGTANIAEAAVLGTIFLFQTGYSRKRRILWGASASIILLVTLTLFLPALMASDDLIQRSGNLDTRQEIWRSLMALWPGLPPGTQFFGFGAGQQPPIMVYISDGYRYWSLSMHSMYFGTLPMIGYIGSFCYLALLAILLRETLLGTSRKDNPIPAFPLAFCVATAILSFSYEIRNDMLIGLFVAIWCLRRSREDTRHNRRTAG